MKKYLRNFYFGFLSWLIPFISSIFFFTKEGKLKIDIFLFKTLMIVIGSISASFLLIVYFKKIKNDYLKEGIIIGISWFLINIILDILILIPMSGMTLKDYFIQIGLRYIAIPAMTVAVGTSLANNYRK